MQTENRKMKVKASNKYKQKERKLSNDCLLVPYLFPST